jgi:hypothetical protein
MDDQRAGKIADESIHFHVTVFPENHWEVPELDQYPELLVCVVDKWTSRICHSAAASTPRRPRIVARSVRGDQNLVGGGWLVEASLPDTRLREAFADDGIVDEFPEDGQRTLLGKPGCFGNGVPDAETESVVVSEFDDHVRLALCGKVIGQKLTAARL